MSFFEHFLFRRRDSRPRRKQRALRHRSTGLIVEQLEDRLVPNGVVVSGYVFSDANNNGLYDAGEVPLAGAAVQLDNASGIVIASAVTDAQGAYAFSTDSTASTAPTTLTQTATVPTAATDWSTTVSLPQFDPTLGTLTAVDIINAGTFSSDIKVENEDPVPATITATDSGTLTLSNSFLTGLIATGSSSQQFNATAFDGVIDFGGTSGHDFGAQTAAATNSTTLTDASVLTAFTGTGSISFTEAAHATSNAAGPGNRVVQINTTASAQVSVIYHYIPNGCLKPGNYTIVLASQPAGYLPGKESSGGVVLTAAPGTNAIPITLASSNLTNNDFAEVAPARIAGSVYFDANNNGVRDAGEFGISGAGVTLTGANDLGSVQLTATTATDGSYQFAPLRPGTYAVTLVQPVDYLPGKETLGSAGGVIGSNLFSGIVLNVGIAGVAYNFGEILPPGSGGQILAASSPGPGFATTFASTDLGAFQAIDVSVLSKLQFLASSGSTNSDPPASANANYVNGLYQNILGRAADPAGLAFFVEKLQNGTSRLQVVDSLWTSPEHRTLEVDQLYALFLHRMPDPAGLTGWVNGFLAGASEDQVASGILASDEYRLAHADDASYVTGLYNDVLGRTGAPTEIAGWVQALQNGTSRQAVALDFLDSTEAAQNVIAVCHTHYLHNAGDASQDQGLLTSLGNGQATLKSLCEAILASDQYFALTQNLGS
jgi:hypothetical protein